MMKLNAESIRPLSSLLASRDTSHDSNVNLEDLPPKAIVLCTNMKQQSSYLLMLYTSVPRGCTSSAGIRPDSSVSLYSGLFSSSLYARFTYLKIGGADIASESEETRVVVGGFLDKSSGGEADTSALRLPQVSTRLDLESEDMIAIYEVCLLGRRMPGLLISY